MEFGLEKMCYASYEKRYMTPDGRNGTTKSRKDSNVQRKRNLGILEADTTIEVEMKEKCKREYLRRTIKTSRYKTT